MPQVFKIKNSTEAGKAPAAGDLKTAELALNLADQKLYSKDAGGTVFEIGKVSDVVISETAPDPARAGQLWWADTDEDDGGGRLYIYTGEEWVDTSLPGGGQGDDFLSKTKDDTANGAITFKGQTTHEAGFLASASSRIDGNTQIFSDERYGLRTKFNGTTPLTQDAFATSSGFTTVASAAKDAICYTTIQAVPQNTTGKFVGYHSAINTTDNAGTGDAYGFYAAGNAPNYFDGTSLFKARIDVGNNFLTNGYDPLTAGQPDVPGGGGISFKLVGDTVIAKSSGTAQQPCIWLNRIGVNNGFVFRFGYAGDFNSVIAGVRRLSSGQWSFVDGSSDYRAKENIADLPSASNLIKALRPVTFNFIGNSNTATGFVAHELQQHIPDAVTGAKDAVQKIGTYVDAEGVETTDIEEPDVLAYGETWTQTGTKPEMQTVDQTRLIPFLTKALQEALERIEALEAKTTIRKKR